MKKSNSSALKGNLKSLVATGGVLAGAGISSNAAIIYTDISDLTISSGQNIYFSLTEQQADTTGAVNEQFRLYFYGGTTPSIDAVGNNTAISVTGGGYNASRLSSGTAINSSLAFRGDYADLPVQWPSGSRGFLGLRLNSGGLQYGWADVSRNVNNSLTLYGFAYEDSGGQIAAGMVPEPAATGVIAALFAGSVAVFDVRRRRKAAKQEAAQSEPVTTA